MTEPLFNRTSEGRPRTFVVQVDTISAEREWRGSRLAPHIMVSGLKLAAQG